jgi:hypothetical protein
MIVEHADAVEEMLALFKAVADGQGWSVEWPNTEFAKPALTATWARWSIQYVTGGQASFGETGNAMFTNTGFVMVELKTPLGSGIRSAYLAAKRAKDAYEGKRTPSDVWFRDVRIVDQPDGRGGADGWWTTVVLADFTYDNLN